MLMLLNSEITNELLQRCRKMIFTFIMGAPFSQFTTRRLFTRKGKKATANSCTHERC